MIQVELRLFGSFRRYESGSPVLALEIENGSTVGALKLSLCDYLSKRFTDFEGSDGRRLVAASAIASEERVLLDEDTIGPGSKLAILPPVCGG